MMRDVVADDQLIQILHLQARHGRLHGILAAHDGGRCQSSVLSASLPEMHAVGKGVWASRRAGCGSAR